MSINNTPIKSRVKEGQPSLSFTDRGFVPFMPQIGGHEVSPVNLSVEENEVMPISVTKELPSRQTLLTPINMHKT
jgi:hypothetical protein